MNDLCLPASLVVGMKGPSVEIVALTALAKNEFDRGSEAQGACATIAATSVLAKSGSHRGSAARGGCVTSLLTSIVTNWWGKASETALYVLQGNFIHIFFTCSIQTENDQGKNVLSCDCIFPQISDGSHEENRVIFC